MRKRQFKATNPHIRRAMSGHKAELNKPSRPFDNGGANDRSKAVEYAQWLASRDGIRLPETAIPRVEFAWVSLSAYVNPIRRPLFVEFETVRIEIPHWNYDPTAPAVDLSEHLAIAA